MIPKLLERLHARDDVGKVTNVDAPSCVMQISGKLLDVDDDAIAIANGRDDRAAVVRMLASTTLHCSIICDDEIRIDDVLAAYRSLHAGLGVC